MIVSRTTPVFPDGQVPAAAGAWPAAMPRDRGGVERDAPRQEEETEGQRGEREGKQTHRHTQRHTGQKLMKALRGKKRRWSDKEKRGTAATRGQESITILRDKRA